MCVNVSAEMEGCLLPCHVLYFPSVTGKDASAGESLFASLGVIFLLWPVGSDENVFSKEPVISLIFIIAIGQINCGNVLTPALFFLACTVVVATAWVSTASLEVCRNNSYRLQQYFVYIKIGPYILEWGVKLQSTLKSSAIWEFKNLQRIHLVTNILRFTEQNPLCKYLYLTCAGN